jgi:hypothetical protein
LLKSVLFAGLLLTSSSAFAVDIGGAYDVLGKNADGSEYKGTAKITLTSESTCRIEWKTGGSTSSGICMRNDDSFAAGYVLGGKVGLIIYKINDDGSLVGLWTIADQEGVGAEVLTPAK